MVALIYVIEWQKQGPPHAHILAISDKESKPRHQKIMTKLSVQKYQMHNNSQHCHNTYDAWPMWNKQFKFTMHGQW